jgi:3-hydroxyacyl-CoA dehydrogenase
MGSGEEKVSGAQEDRSEALRYVSKAERGSAVVPAVEGVRERSLQSVAVIGGGTMGSGIALSFLAAGLPVSIVETDQAAASLAQDRVAKAYAGFVQRGKVSESERDDALRRFGVVVGLENAREADLIIEAAFEDMAVKRDIFGRLDKIAKPGAILATNSSYLDVDVIAAATQRPSDVLGMHFFSPANVMLLVEVVNGRLTAPDTLKTALSASRLIQKLPVVVGVCHGFVGNRMLARRSEQVDRLLLEGASPQEIDAALVDFGFRMGPCAMSDLAGLDISWRMRQTNDISAPAADAVYDTGRRGQKNGRGYYLYPEGARRGQPDPEVGEIVRRVAERQGIPRRLITSANIVERLIYPMINEGARILSEGIAARPGDIDVIWLHGYNWPRWRGGPMYYADQIGLGAIVESLEGMARDQGNPSLEPAELLRDLAAKARGFNRTFRLT